MAFKRYGTLNHKIIQCLNEVPVKNSGTVSEGMALKISDSTGRIEKFTAGAKFLAILEYAPAALVGNAGGTVVAEQVEVDPGAYYIVPQGAVLSDALSQPGCLVDIDSTGLLVTTNSSGDFRVIKRKTYNATKYLVVAPVSRAFP